MQCGEDAWEAVSNTLSGKLPTPVGYNEMGEAEERAVAWRVAAAIGNAQDVAIRLVQKYEKHAGDIVVRNERHD